MTWSVEAGGHHNKTYNEWKEDEYELLRGFVAAFEDTSDETVVSRFRFQGNHVSVNSLDEAREMLREYYGATTSE